jgi:hypothetical protein
MAMFVSMQLSSLLKSKLPDRAARELGEFRHCVHVTTLRHGREIADLHVLDHAATQRVQFGHWGTSCFGLGFNAHNPGREVNSFG